MKFHLQGKYNPFQSPTSFWSRECISYALLRTCSLYCSRVDIGASHFTSFAGCCAYIHPLLAGCTHTHTYAKLTRAFSLQPQCPWMYQECHSRPPVQSSPHPIKSETELIRPPTVRNSLSAKEEDMGPMHVILHIHVELSQAITQAPLHLCFCHVAPCMQSIPDMQVSR